MSNENTSTIISKVWGMCAPLRDDGVSYGDYLEQLTCLENLQRCNEQEQQCSYLLPTCSVY
jgi:type I restriction enzyme M protein